MRIEVVVDVKTTLGEGPVWDVEQQRLYWIDSFDGRILRCTGDGRELRAWDVGQKIGSWLCAGMAMQLSSPCRTGSTVWTCQPAILS